MIRLMKKAATVNANLSASMLADKIFVCLTYRPTNRIVWTAHIASKRGESMSNASLITGGSVTDVAGRRRLRSVAVHQLAVYHVSVTARLILMPSPLPYQQSGIHCLSIYLPDLAAGHDQFW